MISAMEFLIYDIPRPFFVVSLALSIIISYKMCLVHLFTFLLTFAGTSVCTSRKNDTQPRQKPPPLFFSSRNTNPSVFTFSPGSASSHSPSPFTPSFAGSLPHPPNSTPQSSTEPPTQPSSHNRIHASAVTPVLARRNVQRPFPTPSSCSGSRQTTPSTPSTSSFLHNSQTSSTTSKRSRTPSRTQKSSGRELQRCCKLIINEVHAFNRVEKEAYYRSSARERIILDQSKHFHFFVKNTIHNNL